MTKRKRKLKIQTNNKQYSLSDSCFYKLQSKNKLAKLLKSNLSELKQLTNDSNYNCYTDSSGGKARDIEHPYATLDKIQTRIASLICRVEQPDYIHSGIKSRSHVTNAKVHVGNHPVLTSDIQSFYPNTSRKMVFNFFSRVLLCSPDVSNLLADLCIVKGHIPTGSRISMPLAFWANRPMFDSLYAISKQRNINFTVFVDDIAFSGNSIDPQFIHNVKSIIKHHGHSAHSTKTKYYPAGKTKVITGVAVDNDKILVTNKHHKNIYQDLVQYVAMDMAGLSLPELNSRLIGKVSAQSLIDKRFKDKARTLKDSMKKQTKLPF